MSEEELKAYALKHVPTRILLKGYKCVVWMLYRGYCQEDWLDYEHDGSLWDCSVRVDMGRFASWNPDRGHFHRFRYTIREAKAELATRENIPVRTRKCDRQKSDCMSNSEKS